MSELKPSGLSARGWKHGAHIRNRKLYSLWITMIHRCEDEKRTKYKDYGGRGITVCKERHDPNVFMDWAFENGYVAGKQLDRIDNNGNYEPSNCRWVTPKENSRNRRNTVYLTLNGETKCVSEWCETLEISPNTIYWWVKKWGRKYAEQRIERMLKNAS